MWSPTFTLHFRASPRRMFPFAAVVLAVFGLCFPHEAQAKRHKHPSAFKEVMSVNESAKTVEIGTKHTKDHSEQTVTVNDFTEITVDGQKATLHDLKPGMMVDVDMEDSQIAAALDAKNVNPK